MRAASIAGAIVFVFIGAMYLRFSGDAVPSPDPGPSPIARADGSVCIVSRLDPPQDPAPTSVGAESSRAPCTFATPRPRGDPLAGVQPAQANTQPVIPDILQGMAIVPLKLGAPLDLPKDFAVIIETGCTGCEGGPSGLVRVYNRPDGSIAHEPLIDREKLGIPPQLNTAPDGSVYEFRSPLTGYAIHPDGSRIVATLCAREHCGRGGGHYEWSPNSQTAIFSSSDGGITWIEIGRIEAGAEVIALLPDGRVLLATWPEMLKTAFVTFPDLKPVEPPAPREFWRVDALRNGELIWRSLDGVRMWSDGRPLLAVPPEQARALDNDLLVDDLSKDGLAVASGTEIRAPFSKYLVPFDSSGAIGHGLFARRGVTVVWSTTLPLRLGGEVQDEETVFGNAWVPTEEIAANGQPLISIPVPVLVDLKKAIINPLRPFSDPGSFRSRDTVAIQRGPFSRVVNTDDTCLNIRIEPYTWGQSLDCAAEGVLLRISVDAQTDAMFLRVATPAGIEGWASTQYLER